MNVYEDTYNAIMALPCVQRLIKKNKKLRNENKSLRNLIQSLPEFRQQPCCASACTPTTLREHVKIKVEPTTPIHSVTPIDIDDDIKIVDINNVNHPENIVYDIEYENTDVTEKEAEEAEEEEEEEEGLEHLIKEDESRLYLFKRLEEEKEEEEVEVEVEETEEEEEEEVEVEETEEEEEEDV